MPFSVDCGACGAHFKLSQEIYERRIVGRKVALRCKKCKAEIPIDGTKFGDAPVIAPANEPPAPPALDPNFSFVPQVPAAAAITESPPLTARSSAPETLPRDTSWFPAGGSEPAPRIVVETPALPALPAQPLAEPRPDSEPPGREPMATPRVPIAVGREAMPTPRNLEAEVAAAAAAPKAGFDAPEPPTKPGSVALVLAAAEMSEPASGETSTAVEAKEKPEIAPAPSATPRTPEVAPPAVRPSPPRAVVAPRPAADAKVEHPSSPRAAAKPLLDAAAKRELPSRPQADATKRELPLPPKAVVTKPELPSRPKQEAAKRELVSRPKEQATRRDLPSRPKQPTPQQEATPEPAPRPKQESRPQIEAPPARPKQESRPQIEAPPARPKQESRPHFDVPPPPKPDFRPRLESEPRVVGPDVSTIPLAPERARALAAEAVAKALASTEPKPLAVVKEAVQALPVERPISLPPARPSLPPGRRAATIAGLAIGLVVVLVVLGWLLSTVSSQTSVPPVPSGLASVTAPLPPPAPAPEPEEEDEPAGTQAQGTPAAPSPPAEGVVVPSGSSPGLLEQFVHNLNSQAEDKSFDREAALKALDLAASRASRCRSKGDPSGSVTVLVIFNPAGTVKEAKVVGSSYDGSATSRCIASRMATARIKPFVGTSKTLAKSVVIP